MVEKKINLTTNDILEKEFKSGLRGYNQEEVDKFLDLVIKDYEMFHAQLDALKKENEKLKKHAEEPKVKVTPVAPPTPTQFTNTNPDILRRLSNLEKHVFGSKLYD